VVIPEAVDEVLFRLEGEGSWDELEKVVVEDRLVKLEVGI
jgi:hypothetical protein